MSLDASIDGTIAACADIRQFICMRSVKGGAIWRGQDVWKVVRLYFSTEVDEAILYKVNNHLVPDTFKARPCIMLPADIPFDLDRAWYVKEAYSLCTDLGVGV